jgi:hypothetical protein
VMRTRATEATMWETQRTKRNCRPIELVALGRV